MRILHAINSLETGGAQHLLGILLPALREQVCGVEVAVAVERLTGSVIERRLGDAGVSVYEFGATTEVRRLMRLRRLSRQFDIVHAHLFPTLYRVAMACVGRPLVFTEHSTSNRRRHYPIPFRFLDRAVYERYSAVVAISQAVEESLAGWAGECVAGRIEVIPNGVILPAGDAPVTHAGRNCAGEPPVVLMLSRFVEAKNHEMLLRGAAAMERRDIRIVLAGDGPTRRKMMSLACELGISGICKFPGMVDDPSELIEEATVGVQLSRWEGFGLAAVEMMAHGVAVLATDIPGLSDVVGRGAESGGLLVDADDCGGVARNLGLLLSDSDLRRRLGENGRRRARMFDIRKTAREYAALYCRLTGRESIS